MIFATAFFACLLAITAFGLRKSWARQSRHEKALWLALAVAAYIALVIAFWVNKLS
jgi:uncharacterized membrane protein YoaK (UPF0700 family)